MCPSLPARAPQLLWPTTVLAHTTKSSVEEQTHQVWEATTFPFCPVFWPLSLPLSLHTFLCVPELQSALSFPRTRRQRLSSAPGTVLGPALSAQLGPTRVLCHAHRSRPHLARILPETRHLAFTCFASASCAASSRASSSVFFVSCGWHRQKLLQRLLKWLFLLRSGSFLFRSTLIANLSWNVHASFQVMLKTQ